MRDFLIVWVVPAVVMLMLAYWAFIALRDTRTIQEFVVALCWGILMGTIGYFVLPFISSVGEGLQFSLKMTDIVVSYVYATMCGLIAYSMGKSTMRPYRSPLLLLWPVGFFFLLFFLIELLQVGDRQNGRMPGLVMAGVFGYPLLSVIIPIMTHHLFFGSPKAKA